jgi:transposase
MWTQEHRRIYRREGRIPERLRDAEWSRLAPLIPSTLPGVRPCKTEMRAAMNAIPYLLRTDCLRRCLPREGFPPCSTVYNIFRKFQRECSWEANDRDGATPGHWDGRPLTGQIGASGHLTSTHEIEVRGKLRNRIGKIFRTLCMI